MTIATADDDDPQNAAERQRLASEEEEPRIFDFTFILRFPKELEPAATRTFQRWYLAVRHLEDLLKPGASPTNGQITLACQQLLKHMEHTEKFAPYFPPQTHTLWVDGGNTAEAWLRSHGIQPQRTQQRPTGRGRR